MRHPLWKFPYLTKWQLHDLRRLKTDLDRSLSTDPSQAEVARLELAYLSLKKPGTEQGQRS